MTPFTPEELYADFARDATPQAILDTDIENLASDIADMLVENASPDGYQQTPDGEIDYLAIAVQVKQVADIELARASKFTHGGARPGSGRPSVRAGKPQGKTPHGTIRLTDDQAAIARQLGNGNLSEGIRVALEMAAKSL